MVLAGRVFRAARAFIRTVWRGNPGGSSRKVLFNGSPADCLDRVSRVRGKEAEKAEGVKEAEKERRSRE